MALFATEFDKSKYLRAEDVKADKKFRIKVRHSRAVSIRTAVRRRSWCSGSATTIAGWC